MASIVFQTISLVYLLVIPICTSSLLSHDEECLALFHFKQTVLHQKYNGAGGFQKFASWSNTSDSDCCLFDGVVCSNTGHVIGLDWSGSSLSGIINSNSTLFKLVHLQLQKLIHLNIENNPNLTGSLPLFHNNSLLEHLSLALTGFTGTVPKSISNLNHLTYLDLQMCYFSGPIPGSLPNLTELTHLSLSKNEFTGVVPSLASLSKLTFLALGQNNFKKWCAYGWINKLTKLDVLRLSSMNIQDEILPYLANLTKLTFVSLDRNLIFGRIPTSLMNLTQLTSLDISENHLQGQISSTFLNFKSLWYLNLANNNFSGTVGLDSFFGVNKLEYLILNGNRLSFVTTNNYTNDTLPKLKNLGLSSCNLKEFPAFLRQMKMETLSLDDNEIEGVVPNWLWNNSQETLQMISLQSNSITGFYQHPQFLPWIRLEVFAMSNNQLQGRLPIPPETIVI
ncbi:putative leucine-rich repeat-containing, plant-type, leucine-rich repeat domain superfamily [Helianthus annuus]|nr:putative leucine-rich repeat-containing, plant-type, leucine-rich repeat domain superfamily [Helianthus annuus]